MRWSCIAVLLLAAQAAQAQDLLSQLRALPSVARAIEEQSPIPGVRIFEIGFTQPVDHRRPNGDAFEQRINLLHRSTAAPMVFSTQGYNVPPPSAQRELTAIFQTNQLDVEHRFFDESTPSPRAWESLTIEQAAADHHRIVESFKKLYTGPWVSNGTSKGGMTSVYHRYFYPDDVDATVAYVAPSSRGTRDIRYIPFIRRVGTPECRAKLRALQQAALARRNELLPLMPPVPFTIFGKERALEFAILELPFTFWQYQSESRCALIPAPDAAPAELMKFIVLADSPEFFGDELLTFYAPYYYQAATELGAPRYDECSTNTAAQRSLRQIDRRRSGTDPSAVCLLFEFPDQDVPERYPPDDVAKGFDEAIMPRIHEWVLRDGERFLFVYGANDPWSANGFEARASNDSWVYWVTGTAGNHGSNLRKLGAGDRAAALAKLTEWLGVPPVGLQPASNEVERRQRQIDPPTRKELWIH